MADSDPAAGGILMNPPSAQDNQSQPGSGGAAAPPVSDDSGRGRGWRDQIGEDYQSEARLDKYDGPKAVERLAQSALDQETHIGELTAQLNEPIKKPSADASAEEKSRYFARLGRPESPDGYDLSGAEMPEGYEMGTETSSYAREAAHKMGLTPDQANEMVSVIAARDAGTIASVQRRNREALETGMEGLKNEWGGKFEANREIAHRAIDKHFKSSGLQAILVHSGMEAHPAVMKAALSIAKATADGEAPRGVGPPPKADFSDHAFPVAAQIQADRANKR